MSGWQWSPQFLYLVISKWSFNLTLKDKNKQENGI